MEYLRDSVRLRAYGQRDPLVEYKNEGRQLFRDLLFNFEAQVATIILKIQPPRNATFVPPATAGGTPKPAGVNFSNVGRNDPCPCGSGKKYKKCHGR